MSNRLVPCGHCGRGFHPDRFNRHHQKYCLDDGCRAARRRALRRASYRRRLDDDAGFREAERQRCREAMRRLRSARRPGRGACPDPPAPLAVEAVVAGLVAQLTDTSDPACLRRTLCEYADRGRRLAVGDRVRGPPA